MKKRRILAPLVDGPNGYFAAYPSRSAIENEDTTADETCFFGCSPEHRSKSAENMFTGIPAWPEPQPFANKENTPSTTLPLSLPLRKCVVRIQDSAPELEPLPIPQHDTVEELVNSATELSAGDRLQEENNPPMDQSEEVDTRKQRIYDDEIVLRMGLKGAMQDTPGRSREFFMSLDGKIISVLEGGLATRVSQMLDVLRHFMPGKKFAHSTITPLQKFPHPRPPNRDRVSFPNFPYMYRHAAIEHVKASGLRGVDKALQELFYFAESDHPLIYQCNACDNGTEISCADGGQEARSHGIWNHLERGSTSPILCCEICSIIFYNEDEAIEHWRKCREETPTTTIVRKLGPLGIVTGNQKQTVDARSLGQAKLPIKLKQYARFQYLLPDDGLGVFVVEVKDSSLIGISGLLAITCNVPTYSSDNPDPNQAARHLPPKLGFFKDMIDQVHNEWVTFDEAKIIIADSGLPLEALNEVWEFENGYTADEYHKALNCKACGGPIIRAHTAIQDHGRHCSALRLLEEKVGKQWRGAYWLFLYVRECSDCLLLFWSHDEWKDHMQSH